MEFSMAKWLSMTSRQQQDYLFQEDIEKAKKLEILSYEEAAKEFHGLLVWGHSLPIKDSPDAPRGLCFVIDPKANRQTP